MVGINEDGYKGLSVEERKNLFQSKLSENIHVLTGTKPTLRSGNHGGYYIEFLKKHEESERASERERDKPQEFVHERKHTRKPV